MRSHSLLFVTAGLALGACAFGVDVPRYTPENTRVAVVPMVHLSGEKWEQLKEKQVDKGNDFLREAFSSRGFQIVDPWLVQQKIAELKFDMADEEQQKREPLYKLGKAVEADLIVCALIVDTDQKARRLTELDTEGLYCTAMLDDIIPTIEDTGRKVLDPLMPARREGKAKIKLWLLDVKREIPILSSKTAEGKSAGGFFAFFDKGSKRQVQAVANALRDLLKDFMKGYPELKEQEGR